MTAPRIRPSSITIKPDYAKSKGWGAISILQAKARMVKTAELMRARQWTQ